MTATVDYNIAIATGYSDLITINRAAFFFYTEVIVIRDSAKAPWSLFDKLQERILH
jgi:hypothetical protein